MKPIITLTLNPSIDGASEAEKVRPVHKVRTSKERYDPGGGGVNVARVTQELQGEALALYCSGGATGAVLDHLLAERNIPARRIAIADHTRISHTVFETQTGLEYRFVPEGPELSEREWRDVLETLRAQDFDYVVASGSLPRGAPTDFYARAGEIARTKGARLVLDTSGEALRAAMDACGVHIAKPSLGEFEALVGRPLTSPHDQMEAAMSFVTRGCVDHLAVTMGHEGAILASREGAMRFPALKVEARSAVGAGDSFVAALTLALARGRSARDAFRYGMAAGTAAVLTPGTEMCRREDVERLYAEFARMPDAPDA